MAAWKVISKYLDGQRIFCDSLCLFLFVAAVFWGWQKRVLCWGYSKNQSRGVEMSSDALN